MLQIKNALGGGKPEGLYAWKKYNVVHVNGSATFSCVGSSSLSIKNANFDITSIDDYVSFFNGFKVSDTEYYFNVNADGKLVFNVNSTTSFIVNKFDGTQTSSQFSLSAVCSAFTQTLSEENGKVISYEFIDYIVSDKETAYPDGGEKNGYWYERVKDVDLLTAGGYTKIAVDKFTFSSATSITNAISHSLGEIPLFYLIVADIPSALKNDFLGAFYFKPKFQSTNTEGVYYYARGDNTYSTPSVGELKTLTDSSISIFNNTTYKYKAGVEYTLITMA